MHVVGRRVLATLSAQTRGKCSASPSPAETSVPTSAKFEVDSFSTFVFRVAGPALQYSVRFAPPCEQIVVREALTVGH
jgi:hypothetical protein